MLYLYTNQLYDLGTLLVPDSWDTVRGWGLRRQLRPAGRSDHRPPAPRRSQANGEGDRDGVADRTVLHHVPAASFELCPRTYRQWRTAQAAASHQHDRAAVESH